MLKKPYASVVLVLLALTAFTGCKSSQRPASVLNAKDHLVLDGYEKVRQALAQDDIRGAARASGQLAESLKPASPADKPDEMYAPAKAVSESTALDRSRDNFKALSVAAVRRAGDVEGYYVMTCPMRPDAEWLQASRNIDNPYMGKVMHDCGNIKR